MAISEMKMQMVIANYFKDECDVNTSIRQAFEKGFRIGLKKGISANRPQEWIPCSERLPKENTEVLMSLEWGVDIGEYRNGEWHSEWINHYDDDNVLAWMPLPKPWKGADDDMY